MSSNEDEEKTKQELFCGECGEPTNKEAQFCSKCGARFKTPEEIAPSAGESVNDIPSDDEQEIKPTDFRRDSFSQNFFRAIGRFILRLSATIIYTLFALSLGGLFLFAIPFFLIWTILGLIPRRRGLCPYCGMESMNELIANDRKAIECSNCDQKSIYDEKRQMLFPSRGYRGKSTLL